MRKGRVLVVSAIICIVIVITYLIHLSFQKISSIEAMNTLLISINGQEINLTGEGEINSLNVNQLSSTNENILTINEIDKIQSLKLNNEEVEIEEEIRFNVEEIDFHNRIKISVKYESGENYLDYYINTLNTYFPIYEIQEENLSQGEYYLTSYSNVYNAIFRLDEEERLIFYSEIKEDEIVIDEDYFIFEFESEDHIYRCYKFE